MFLYKKKEYKIWIFAKSVGSILFNMQTVILVLEC